ncbi:megf10 [Symbiodinium sp. CCMP2592]|nr:megf10 [Symbiodinium sp. CCMP2592]
MRSKCVLGLLLLRQCIAQTVVNSSLVETVTLWTFEGSPYIVEQNVAFRASLIVQPGVVVRFFAGAGLTFDTGSSFQCQGDSAFPVLLTRYDDQVTYWQGLEFTAQISDTVPSFLQHCVVEGATVGVRIANRAPQFLPGTTITDAFSQAVYALGPMVTPMAFDGVIVNNSNGVEVRDASTARINVSNSVFDSGCRRGAARLHVLSAKGEVTVTGSLFETRFYAGCQTLRQNTAAFYLTDASQPLGNNVTVADTTFLGMETGVSLFERYGDMDFRVSNCTMKSIGNFFRLWSSRSRARIESSTFRLPPGADGRTFGPVGTDVRRGSTMEVSRCLFEGAKASSSSSLVVANGEMSFVENVMQNCEGSRGLWIRSLGCLVTSNLMVNNTFQTSVIDADSNVTLLNNTLDNPDSTFELEAPFEGSASGRSLLDARTMTFGEAGPKANDFSVSMGRWRVLLADRYRQALPSFQSNTVIELDKSIYVEPTETLELPENLTLRIQSERGIQVDGSLVLPSGGLPVQLVAADPSQPWQQLLLSGEQSYSLTGLRVSDAGSNSQNSIECIGQCRLSEVRDVEVRKARFTCLRVVNLRVPLTVSDSSFHDCFAEGVVLTGGDAALQVLDSSFANTDGYTTRFNDAVLLNGFTGDVLLANNSVEGFYDGLLVEFHEGSVEMRGNVVTRYRGYGLSLRHNSYGVASAYVITNNTVRGGREGQNTGREQLRVEASSSRSLQSVAISDNYFLDQDVVNKNAVRLNLRAALLSFRGNRLLNDRSRLELSLLCNTYTDLPHEIVNNTFNHDSTNEVIYILNCENVTLRENVILANTSRNSPVLRIHGVTSGIINASVNYWGEFITAQEDGTGLAIESVIDDPGEVAIYEPWLSEPYDANSLQFISRQRSQIEVEDRNGVQAIVYATVESGNETLPAGDYLVAAPIIVRNGGRLVLDAGVKLTFAADMSVLVGAGSALLALGTEEMHVILDGHETFEFEVGAHVADLEFTNDMLLLPGREEYNGSLLLYTDILNGKQDGLLARSAVPVIGGRFSDNAWHGIYIDSVTAPILVQGTNISASYSYDAIEVRNAGSHVHLVNNTLTGQGWRYLVTVRPLSSQPSVSWKVENNSFKDGGLYVYGLNARGPGQVFSIAGNIFFGIRYSGTGIFLDDLAQDATSLSEPGWRIVGNEFIDWSVGNTVIFVDVSSLAGANTLLHGNEFKRVVSSRRRCSLVRLFANRQDKVEWNLKANTFVNSTADYAVELQRLADDGFHLDSNVFASPDIRYDVGLPVADSSCAGFQEVVKIDLTGTGLPRQRVQDFTFDCTRALAILDNQEFDGLVQEVNETRGRLSGILDSFQLLPPGIVWDTYNLLISPNATLVIPPGSVLLVHAGSNSQIRVEGTLQCRGLPDSRIQILCRGCEDPAASIGFSDRFRSLLFTSSAVSGRFDRNTFEFDSQLGGSVLEYVDIVGASQAVDMNGRSPVLRFVNTRGSLNGFNFNRVQDDVLMQGCELNGTTRWSYTGISLNPDSNVASGWSAFLVNSKIQDFSTGLNLFSLDPRLVNNHSSFLLDSTTFLRGRIGVRVSYAQRGMSLTVKDSNFSDYDDGVYLNSRYLYYRVPGDEAFTRIQGSKFIDAGLYFFQGSIFNIQSQHRVEILDSHFEAGEDRTALDIVGSPYGVPSVGPESVYVSQNTFRTNRPTSRDEDVIRMRSGSFSGRRRTSYGYTYGHVTFENNRIEGCEATRVLDVICNPVGTGGPRLGATLRGNNFAQNEALEPVNGAVVRFSQCSSSSEFTNNLMVNPASRHELEVEDAVIFNATENWWGTADLQEAAQRVVPPESANISPILLQGSFSCETVANCSGNGICSQPETCSCDSGWAGNSCQEVDCTEVLQCSGRGVCVEPNVCNCSDGWLPPFCATATCDAVSNCGGLQRGVCVRPDTCTCRLGYTGDDCLSCASGFYGAGGIVSTCLPCPLCRNGGTCDPIEGGCQCPARFSGDLCESCSEGFFGPSCEALPGVRDLAPAVGTDLGGLLLTVRGYNFPNSPDARLECRFGNPPGYSVTVNATWRSNSSLTCRVPRWESPEGPSETPLVVTIAGEPIVFGPALTFEYTTSCAADACGNNLGRGFCITGICSCVLPWSGPNCSEELLPPTIDSVSSPIIIQEGASFSRVLTAQGTSPISWVLVSGPLGLVIDVSSGELMWPSAVVPPAPADAWQVEVSAANDVGEDSIILQLEVPPSYSAEVSIDRAGSPALDSEGTMLQGGFPVLLRGRVLYNASTVELVLFKVLVWVDVTSLAGERVRRTLTAFASVQSAGVFQVYFTPKLFEGGIYTIGAMHPSLTENDPEGTAAQTNFSVAVLTSSRQAVFGAGGAREPVRVDFFLPELLLLSRPLASSVEAAFALDNRGETRVSGIRIEIVSWRDSSASGAGLPEQLESFEALTTTDLPGRTSAPVNVSYRANASFFGVLTLRVSSNEGLTWDVFIFFEVRDPRAALQALPASVVVQAPRGSLTTVAPIEIRNVGSAAATNLTVELPPDPLLVVVGAVDPDIPVGSSSQLQLGWAPGQTQELETFQGTLVVRSSTDNSVWVRISYTVAVVSTGVTNVSVYVQDEYSFHDAENGFPNVTGALCDLTQPRLQQTLRRTTDASGLAYFEDVPNDRWSLRCQASEHSPSSEVLVVSGGELIHTVLLPRDAVTYVWTVRPTAVEDVYEFTTTTTFETNVPMPVVTVEPVVFNLDLILVGGLPRVDLTITNHGLIATDSFKINWPTIEGVEFAYPSGPPPDIIRPNTSIIVPVDIILASRNESDQGLALLQKRSGCTLGDYVAGVLCGPVEVSKSGGLTFSTSGPCGFSLTINGNGGFGGGGRNFEGGGPGRGGGGTIATVPFVITTEGECDPCTKEIVDCVVAGTKLIPIRKKVKVVTSCPKKVKDAVKENKGLSGIGSALGECFKTIWETFNEVKDVIECITKTVDCKANSLLQRGAVDRGALARSADLAEFTSIVKRATHRSHGHLAQKHLSASERRLVLGSVTAAQEAVEFWAESLAAIGAVINEIGPGDFLASESFDTEWFQQVLQYQSDGSEDGVLLSSAEAADLLASAPPGNLTGNRSALEFLVQRVNNTAYANSLGFLSRADAVAQGLPENMMDYFFAFDNLTLFEDRQNIAALQGFSSVVDAADVSLRELRAETQKESEGICAKVTIRIVQELVLTRQAFEGVLEVGNNAGSPMEEIVLSVFIEDDQFNGVEEKFAIGEPSAGGDMVLQSPATATNGSGVQTMAMLAARGQGTLSLLIIPRREAAPTRDPQNYRVGGTLFYTQDGVRFSVPLYPDTIQVLPDPVLTVRYFRQRFVEADDPFTEEVEPSVPFLLATCIANTGFGTARSMRLSSAQPEIVDNERDLLITFEIVETRVNGELSERTLTAEIGDLLPDNTTVIEWLLTASLKGEFTSLTTTFENRNPLGDPELSLVEAVSGHDLIRTVRLRGPNGKMIEGFFVNEVPDSKSLPDTIFSSEDCGPDDGALVRYILDKDVSVTLLSGLVVNVTIHASVGQATAILEQVQDGRIVGEHSRNESDVGYVYLRFARPAGLAEGSSFLVACCDDEAVELQNAWETSDDENASINIFDEEGRCGEYFLYFGQPEDADPQVCASRQSGTSTTNSVTAAGASSTEPSTEASVTSTGVPTSTESSTPASSSTTSLPGAGASSTTASETSTTGTESTSTTSLPSAGASSTTASETSTTGTESTSTTSLPSAGASSTTASQTSTTGTESTSTTSLQSAGASSTTASETSTTGTESTSTTSLPSVGASSTTTSETSTTSSVESSAPASSSTTFLPSAGASSTTASETSTTGTESNAPGGPSTFTPTSSSIPSSSSTTSLTTAAGSPTETSTTGWSTGVSTSSPRRYYRYYKRSRRSWKCVWGEKWRCWGLFCCDQNRRCLPRMLCRQPSSSSAQAAQLSGMRASEIQLLTDGGDASHTYNCKDICKDVCEMQHPSPTRCPHLCSTRLDAVLHIAQVFCVQGLCSSVTSTNQTHEEAGLLQKRVRRTEVFSEEAEVGCQQPAKYCRLFCKQGVLLENTIQQCLAGCQAKFSLVLTQMQAFVRGGCCESR